MTAKSATEQLDRPAVGTDQVEHDPNLGQMLLWPIVLIPLLLIARPDEPAASLAMWAKVAPADFVATAAGFMSP